MEFTRLDPENPEQNVRPPRKRGVAALVLVAAMDGLANALGWERTKEETVEVADAPKGGDGLSLDYKHLDPLEP